jgi:hypothetical protein
MQSLSDSHTRKHATPRMQTCQRMHGQCWVASLLDITLMLLLLAVRCTAAALAQSSS